MCAVELQIANVPAEPSKQQCKGEADEVPTQKLLHQACDIFSSSIPHTRDSSQVSITEFIILASGPSNEREDGDDNCASFKPSEKRAMTA